MLACGAIHPRPLCPPHSDALPYEQRPEAQWSDADIWYPNVCEKSAHKLLIWWIKLP
jgi:hypothetical protein